MSNVKEDIGKKSLEILELFFSKSKQDACIDSVHISLFMALFYKWVDQSNANHIKLERNNIMEAAKISSTATYFRKIQYLNQNGYIEYFPSFFAKENSIVRLFNK